MKYEDFLLSSRVKIDGTLLLEQTFLSTHLDFFLMLSSAVNIVGGGGQASYIAGNSVQDAIAHSRSSSSCHFMSFNIGWVEGAVVTATHETRQNGLRRAGLKPILPGSLLRFLDYALGASEREFAQCKLLLASMLLH